MAKKKKGQTTQLRRKLSAQHKQQLSFDAQTERMIRAITKQNSK